MEVRLQMQHGYRRHTKAAPGCQYLQGTRSGLVALAMSGTITGLCASLAYQFRHHAKNSPSRWGASLQAGLHRQNDSQTLINSIHSGDRAHRPQRRRGGSLSILHAFCFAVFCRASKGWILRDDESFHNGLRQTLSPSAQPCACMRATRLFAASSSLACRGAQQGAQRHSSGSATGQPTCSLLNPAHY